MRRLVIVFLRRIGLYHPLRNCLQSQRQRSELALWEKNGNPIPVPHLIKQRVLLEYSEKYNLRILVETGTYLGDMVEAMLGSFDKIYSIELGADLFEMARNRFSRDKHVEIVQGDSGRELAKVVAKINRPALFWLDGHYSGGVTARGDLDCPIFEELDCISSGPVLEHVIIIDDARCFGTESHYPTLDELRARVALKWGNVGVSIQDDIVRITPVMVPAVHKSSFA